MVQLLKDGAVTQEYAYDAYGYINADEFGIQAPFYGYNGEEQNPFTGLQYLRARYYAPQNGGFITQDSFSGVLTNALSQNRYTYAHNNPVNYADPSGHSILDSIKNGVTNAVNSVKNFVSNVANKVSSAVSSAVNTVKSAVTGTTTKTVANTSSAVKKSYTNTAVRQKIGSYAGGAAAAAAGSVSTSYSNSVVNGVIADSRIPFTNAAGQTVMLPSHFSDTQAAAQAFTRQGCSTNLLHYTVQTSSQEVIRSWNWPLFWNYFTSYMSGAGTQFQQMAMSDLTLPFGDIIGLITVGGMAIYSVIQAYDQVKSYVDAKAEEREESDSIVIYRTGSGNATNLTPRPVDFTGLSYTTVQPVGPYTTTTIGEINATGVLMAIKDSPTHVSVVPVNLSTMQEWIDSRPTALTNPHAYTLLLQSISTKVR